MPQMGLLGSVCFTDIFISCHALDSFEGLPTARGGNSLSVLVEISLHGISKAGDF